jgi:prophage regulatory protein
MRTEKTTPILIRLPEVKRRTGISRSLIYRLIQEGTFPQKIPLVGITVAWSSADIDQWINERIAAAQEV